MIPSPRARAGDTLGHATEQQPPFVVELPLQRNDRRNLSIHLMTQGEISIARAVWTGIAESLALISTARPALLIRDPFHVGRQLATLSTRGYRSAFFNREIARGMPRYLTGKGASFPGKKRNKVNVSSRSQ